MVRSSCANVCCQQRSGLNVDLLCFLAFFESDLMWSDPEDIDTWRINPRGAGWLFGSKVVSQVRACVVRRELRVPSKFHNRGGAVPHFDCQHVVPCH